MSDARSRRHLLLGLLAAPLLRSNVCGTADAAYPPGMEGFSSQTKTIAGIVHAVYKIGKGPAVFVCHEVPGLYRADIDLARRVADRGFTAFVPLFFGKAGDCNTNRNLFSLGLNPASEFSFWLPRTPAVARWLAPQLAPALAECGGNGVAVIGMCLTGSLPLALMSSTSLGQLPGQIDP